MSEIAMFRQMTSSVTPG